MAFQLPDLPYDFNALEPHIDEDTMRIHHDKHHNAYTNGLNSALEKYPSLQNKPIEELLTNIDAVPADIRGAVNFHGGGFFNHSVFWQNMSPNGGGQPSGEVADAISSTFGSFEKFQEEFKAAATSIQGSGWAWLAFNPVTRDVEIRQMPNQTSILTEGLKPLLGLDMWEHAFYLKHQNNKGAYVDEWWNVVNWDDVEKRLKDAR